MKSLFKEINQSEKRRILEMHYSKSNRFILEQDDDTKKDDNVSNNNEKFLDTIKNDSGYQETKTNDLKNDETETKEPQFWEEGNPKWALVLPKNFNNLKNKGCLVMKGSDIMGPRENVTDSHGAPIIEDWYYTDTSKPCN